MWAVEWDSSMGSRSRPCESGLGHAFWGSRTRAWEVGEPEPDSTVSCGGAGPEHGKSGSRSRPCESRTRVLGVYINGPSFFRRILETQGQKKERIWCHAILNPIKKRKAHACVLHDSMLFGCATGMNTHFFLKILDTCHSCCRNK